MKQKSNRREFIRIAALSGAGLGLQGPVFSRATPVGAGASVSVPEPSPILPALSVERPSFIPRRAASWWTTLEDICWPEKKITDKIKRRAENFAKARIDTAINFGFHVRFDFSNYFGQLHGYFANVCEELHKVDIKFMEHYSCNHVERPRGEAGLRTLQKTQRHHVLLFNDPVSAPFAQYEGHNFNGLCEIDLRDGSRGFATDYQLEVFCHNNPNFLDMHRKYLQRLMREVPIDGIEVDDMCDYAGLTTCSCQYCRERFRKEYGHEIPTYGTGYEDPIFRDWLRMKSDSVADHLKMIKSTIGNLPLMTCCSNAGPIVLNGIALNLEKMAPYLDFFMLENVGIGADMVNWMIMDAEAMYQKDVAQKKGNAPAITISYMIYPKGGYLGWSLGRFWGVANWSSTLNQRLEEDPIDASEVEDIISPYNNWDVQHCHPDETGGKDLVEVRLVCSSYCRENGWRGSDGREQWDRVQAWSDLLIKHNTGYRLVRSEELSDGGALCAEHTPLILDGVACVSDNQFKAIDTLLSKGGIVWMALPFGTHDEKGFPRPAPLSDKITHANHKNLLILPTATASDPLADLISKKKFSPVLRQVSGNPLWAARIRFYEEGPSIHFLNRGLIAIPHATLKDAQGRPILKDFYASGKDPHLEYEFDAKRVQLSSALIQSPELGDQKREAVIRKDKKDFEYLQVDLSGVETYAVAQGSIGK